MDIPLMVDTLLMHLNYTLQGCSLQLHVQGSKPTTKKRSRHTIECDYLMSALPQYDRLISFTITQISRRYTGRTVLARRPADD